MILYILKFENHNLVKIGITKDLLERIKTLEKDLGINFNLAESFIITADNRDTIRVLERQLLMDLKNCKLKKDHPYKLPEKSKIKCSEIRTSELIDTCLELLKEKTQKLKLPLKFHQGIDLSGIKSIIIPSTIIPPGPNGSDVLIDALIDFCEEKKQCLHTVYSEIIYKWAIEAGITFEERYESRSVTCYYLDRN